MAKTKQAPEHTRDHPEVRAAQEKQVKLENELSGVHKQIETLEHNQTSDVEHEARAMLGTAVATAPPSVELEQARRRESALKRAVQLQGVEIRKQQQVAGNEIREELQPRLDEALGECVASADKLRQAHASLGEILQEASARGAAFAAETWVPILGDPNQQRLLHLPQPQLSERCFKQHFRHIQRFLPQLSRAVDAILTSMK